MGLIMRIMFSSIITALVFQASAEAADAPYLYGIHWYGNTDSISVGQKTDVEAMSGDRGIWDLEITHVDASQASGSDLPSGYVSHARKVITGKGHSIIFRVQPYWGRNVPHPSDPYTLSQYAADCLKMATTLRDYCHIWQIGNEVNLRLENNRWSGSSYNVEWEPSPAEYAQTWLACRDAIHEITPNTSPSRQIVLMQPVSPGNGDTSVGRFMDGNEYLWRQIEAIGDKSKIDGFGIHSYARPGTPETGLEGFWEAIREQLMIIDEWGLGDRPVYMTEWNKHMPNAAEAAIAAKFLHRAYAQMDGWNKGTGGTWPGQPNHNIVGAMWFVYPRGSWDDYSLQHWKTQIVSTDPEQNPWYAFQYASSFDYVRGAEGGGPAFPPVSLQWADDFNGPAGAAPDSSAPLPVWKPFGGGTNDAVLSGDGALRLVGRATNARGSGVKTAGHVFGNFVLNAEVVITNGSRWNLSIPESLFNLNFREGSKGYSLTINTGGGVLNDNRIVLRRTNDWTVIGNYNAVVPGGVRNGDSFQIHVDANGPNLAIRVTKNNNTGAPVVDWKLNDEGQRVGWISLSSYNVQEVRVNRIDLTAQLGASVQSREPMWLLW